MLKADIKHYFDNVNHLTLLGILQKQIQDQKVLLLIKNILSNYSTEKSMPLGNLTSQFFANVYLNELDQFVKHRLKAKYYVRYVDDFVIIHNSKEVLEKFKLEINWFLNEKLALQLHPDKSKIIYLGRGIGFLGFIIFPHYCLLKKRNLKKFKRKLEEIYLSYDKKEIDYNAIYDFMEGWCAYAKHANTYKLRQKILTKFEAKFSGEISYREINRSLMYSATKKTFQG